jgi:hypothetical protein
MRRPIHDRIVTASSVGRHHPVGPLGPTPSAAAVPDRFRHQPRLPGKTCETHVHT